MKFFSNNTLGDETISFASNPTENAQTKTIILYPPEPFTDEHFEEVIAKKTLENMSDEEFQKIFSQNKDGVDLEKIVPDAINNDAFVKYANKSLDNTLQEVIDYALDGKKDISYSLLFQICDFTPEEQQYIALNKTAEQVQEALPEFMELRFANMPDLTHLVGFIDQADKIHQGRERGTIGLPMMEAQELYQQAQLYEGILKPTQRAKMYYLQSEVFRKSNVMPNAYGEGPACESELQCLIKALVNSDDLKIITCCHDRLKSQSQNANRNIFDNNTNNIIAAYKRVLTKSTEPDELYRANKKLASLYWEKTEPKRLNKRLEPKDRANLRWSAFYLKKAYENAAKNNCISTLNNMLKIYRLLENRQMIFNIKKERINYLPKQDKINASIDLAIEMSDKFTTKDIETIWDNLKTVKMPLEGKHILQQKYVDYLPQITKDKTFIDKVTNEFNQQDLSAFFLLKRRNKQK